MAMLNRNLRNIAIGARFLQQAREDVSSALAGVGFATCHMMAHRAAASQQPAGGGRHGTITGIFISGVGTMWAAGWVAADPARRRATGWMILCASLVPMLIAVGLSNDYDVFDILREIAP